MAVICATWRYLRDYPEPGEPALALLNLLPAKMRYRHLGHMAVPPSLLLGACMIILDGTSVKAKPGFFGTWRGSGLRC